MAASAYKFLADKMLDKSSALFNWEVSRDGGTILNSKKVLYGNWFGVFGAATYGTVFSDQSAKDVALACFKAMDSIWHNSSTGGFNELLSNALPDDVSFDPKSTPDQIRPTTTNTILHGIEALSALYTATGDAIAKDRLLELLRIASTQMITSDGVLYEVYTPATAGQPWTPVTSGTQLAYGHMMELSWLIVETVNALQSAGAIDQAVADSYKSKAVSLGEKAVALGYDNEQGGFYNTGSPSGGVSSKVKVWWVQNEGALGLWNLYSQKGKDPGYYQKLVQTVNFIEKYLNDAQYGEQYWQVEANGENKDNYSPGPNVKSNKWKASYHTLRMLTRMLGLHM